MSVDAAQEALRIARRLEVEFPGGPAGSGSGFRAGPRGRIITCHHVVVNEQGQRARTIRVLDSAGRRHDATIALLDERHDLAALNCPDDTDAPRLGGDELPVPGEALVFAGQPDGVRRLSAFPGMVSQSGPELGPRGRCDHIQIAGMINNGNSGGPLLRADTCEVLGVVTAKYVPLLQEIEEMRTTLKSVPQFPSSVDVGGIDFSRFVNSNVAALTQLASVLRLVQVGTGWAVPVKYLRESSMV